VSQEVNILKKTDLDLESLNSASWKWLNSEESKISGGENSRQPQAFYFFANEQNHSYCRRYNKVVNFRRDVEDIGLCDKCGMRFRTYRAAQICIFAPAEPYFTIDSRDDGKAIEEFPDKDLAEKGVSDFESKSWQ